MRLNVGVVFGGKSVEHEVSIISALQMMENMNKLIYQPIPIYLSKDNEFYYHESMINMNFFKDFENVKKNSQKVIFKNENKKHFIHELKNNKLKSIFEIDVVFLVVHGTLCEDGTLSAFFELLEIPYVGGNVLSSAINQNKWKMKQILEQNQIPLVNYYGFYENDFYQDEENTLKLCEAIGYPLIVKPASLGSSVGITKCRDRMALKKAIITALQYDNEIVVEKAITNLMELNCSVLGDHQEQLSSEVERVIQSDEILSYQDKYLRGDKHNTKGMVNTNRVLPADIDEDLKNLVQEHARKVFKIIGCSGVSRIDFLYDKDENKLYVNEINTIPGSLSYYLWQKSGLSYKELINKMIDLGIRKYRIKNSKIFTYDTNILSLPRNFNKGKIT